MLATFIFCFLDYRLLKQAKQIHISRKRKFDPQRVYNIYDKLLLLKHKPVRSKIFNKGQLAVKFYIYSSANFLFYNNYLSLDRKLLNM